MKVDPEAFVAILGWWWWLVAFGLLVLSSYLSYKTGNILSIVPGVGGISILFAFIYLAADEAKSPLHGWELVVVNWIPVMFYFVTLLLLMANHFRLSTENLKHGRKGN